MPTDQSINLLLAPRRNEVSQVILGKLRSKKGRLEPNFLMAFKFRYVRTQLVLSLASAPSVSRMLGPLG